MDQKTCRDLGMAYISDESIMEEQKVCRRILQKLNTADRSDFDTLIMLGVHIGSNTVIGAGSVVTKDIDTSKVVPNNTNRPTVGLEQGRFLEEFREICDCGFQPDLWFRSYCV